MTPKEKAKELLSKMCNSLDEDNGTGSGGAGCALIAVDEILSMELKPSIYREFWQQVRTEIENL
jgi:hypothetical protein